MTESTAQRIAKSLKQVTDKPLPSDHEESLFESGILDSFALTDLIAALEQEFSINVPDSDLNPRKFDNLARIEAYVSSRL